MSIVNQQGSTGNQGGGDYGVPTDPWTLTGTAITGATTAALAMQLRTARAARRQLNAAELWFYRDSAWRLLPDRYGPLLAPEYPLTITQQWRQPAQLQMYLADQFGDLTTENMVSAINLNLASAWDPVLKADRNIILRAGTYCYANLAAGIAPTATIAPGTGTLAQLTDGVLGDISSSTANYVQFALVPGVATDTFTAADGTLLSAHTSDTGQSWHVDAGTPKIESNQQTTTAAANTTMRVRMVFTPPTAEYNVSADCTLPLGTSGTFQMFLTARATDNTHYYAAGFYNGAWRIYYNNGAGNVPLPAVPATWNVGDTHNLRFECLNAKKTLYVDGVAVVSTTDNTVIAVGNPGLYTYNQVSGVSGCTVDNFTCTSPSLDLVVDTGSSYMIRHAVIRFATKLGTCTLPATVEIDTSPDNATWTPIAPSVRPVGGTGGDWADDAGISPRPIEVAFTDIRVPARYVRFRIISNGTQNVYIDELAVYGGVNNTLYGYNVFYGYTGSGTQIDNTGLLQVTCTDGLKKLIDNNSVMLTQQYGNPPVEVADIVYSLLVGVNYWQGLSGAYDAPIPGAQIGWSSGTNLTGFKFPVWQGQANNMYGYVGELLNEIGGQIYCDGNGVYQIQIPPYRQTMPDRVMIADADGNIDAWLSQKQEDDTDQRNAIEVRTAAVNAGGTSTVMVSPSSISQYGKKFMSIMDPLATDLTTREKVCSSVLRDYAFRLAKMSISIRPDYDTIVKGVLGFRGSYRPALYSLGTSARVAQLWLAESVTHNIRIGDWTADIQAVGYAGLGPGQPTGLTATPHAGVNTQIDLAWTAPSDADVNNYAIYVSSVGPSTGFPLTPSHYVGSAATAYSVTGLTNGTQYWFFVTAIGQSAIEGTPSSVVTAVAGGNAGDDSYWTVTDLAANFSQVATPTSTDAYYEYELLLAWTSPPVGYTTFQQNNYGFKHGEFRYNIGSIPASPSVPQNWQYDSEWNGDRVPSGLEWDRVTIGQLTWYMRFRSASSLSGQTIYCVLFTWFTTNGEHGPSHQSNIVSVVIP